MNKSGQNSKTSEGSAYAQQPPKRRLEGFALAEIELKQWRDFACTNHKTILRLKNEIDILSEQIAKLEQELKQRSH